MPETHCAYKAFERAKEGRYPDARFRYGKKIKDWIRAIDRTYPDEKLTPALQNDKRRVLFPVIAFLSLHPGCVDGEEGLRLSTDFKWFQNIYDRTVKKLEEAVSGHGGDLYERSTRGLRSRG